MEKEVGGMTEPALLEAILFFAFCLATIIVYEFKWDYVPVVGIAWLIAGTIMTGLIFGYYTSRFSCFSCPWVLMPNYGWFSILASLNAIIPPIVILLSVWTDVKR